MDAVGHLVPLHVRPRWVQVKYYYGLSVDSAEKSALTSYLSGC